MTTGKIVSLKDGFGFIKVDGQEKELFFHANELQGVQFDTLKEGDNLQFEITEGPKGPQATNVSKADAAAAPAEPAEEAPAETPSEEEPQA